VRNPGKKAFLSGAPPLSGLSDKFSPPLASLRSCSRRDPTNLAQCFSAGRAVAITPEVLEGRLKPCSELILQSSLRGLALFSAAFPGMNAWAIIKRPFGTRPAKTCRMNHLRIKAG
jgi:hypothetical protein